jgi:HK97 family phage major capsid protein
MDLDIEDISRQISDEIKGFGEHVQSQNAEIKSLREYTEGLEKKINRGKLGGGPRDLDGLAEHKAIAKYARTDDQTELKAMNVGSDPDGGYLVLPVMAQTMITKLFDTTPIRQMARVETITIGDAWEEPIDNDQPDAVWVGEQTPRPASKTAQVGMLRVPVQEIYALQPITQRLLDDTGFNLGAWLEGKLTNKFARSEGTAFVTGDGGSKPRGFMNHNIVTTSDATRAWGDLQYFPSGDANTIQADALRSLVWGLRAPYRDGAQFLMNSNTASTIDKLKDGDGEYLWRNSMAAGVPDTMLGYPVEFSEDLADVAANNFPIAFGNFKLGYLIVDKAGIKMLRDPYTSKPNVLFYAYKRVGGDVANSEAIKVMKIATS